MFEAIVTLPFLSCAIVCVYWYVFISCINSLCKLCHIFLIVAFFLLFFTLQQVCPVFPVQLLIDNTSDRSHSL